jgi:hypothetical protein
MADPQRPKYAPLLSPQSPQSQSGILGYQFVVGDDGLALVEFVGATRAAFATLLADPSIKVCLRGRDSREAMEAEFLKHKKNFDFVHFGVLMPLTVSIRVTLLVLMTCAAASLLPAQSYEGYIDQVSCGQIGGWAYDGNTDRVDVTILTYNSYQPATVLTTVVANLYRADLPGAGIGDGYHAFSIPIPPDLINGQGYYISAVFGNYNPNTLPTYLTNSGLYVLQCSATTPLSYTYYQPASSATNIFTSSLNPSKWTQDGTSASPSASIGLSNPDGYGVALLSSQAVPNNATDYEVNANLAITGSSNGAFVLYLRATAGSLLRGGYGGSYNAPYLTTISCTGQAPSLSCTGLLYLYQSINGQLTLSSYTTVPLHNGSTFRGVVHGTEGAIYIDNVLYMFYVAVSPTGTTGPGIGVNGSTNGITSVSLGSTQD